ncbi:MAG: hypothetical protein WA021_05195 [Minisyncoccia bacterium]
MEGLQGMLGMTLSFLLNLLELLVGFFIAALNLILDFARTLAGSVQ